MIDSIASGRDTVAQLRRFDGQVGSCRVARRLMLLFQQQPERTGVCAASGWIYKNRSFVPVWSVNGDI